MRRYLPWVLAGVGVAVLALLRRRPPASTQTPSSAVGAGGTLVSGGVSGAPAMPAQGPAQSPIQSALEAIGLEQANIELARQRGAAEREARAGELLLRERQALTEARETGVRLETERLRTTIPALAAAERAEAEARAYTARAEGRYVAQVTGARIAAERARLQAEAEQARLGQSVAAAKTATAVEQERLAQERAQAERALVPAEMQLRLGEYAIEAQKQKTQLEAEKKFTEKAAKAGVKCPPGQHPANVPGVGFTCRQLGDPGGGRGNVPARQVGKIVTGVLEGAAAGARTATEAIVAGAGRRVKIGKMEA